MKVLVTGGGGQLSNALVKTVPTGTELIVLTIDDLDITRRDAVMEKVGAIHPDAVINAAAYTAVDAAESHRDEAFAVNAEAADYLAQAAQSVSARLVHVSTDFVFDGTKSTPYLPGDTPHPLSVYGASKLEGERRVLAGMPGAVVIRTAWVYAENGKNFVHTMLRLCAERDSISVVMDQVGSPTWATSLALAVWRALDHGVAGVHHWVDAGVISWYDFAIAIQEEALALGLLSKKIPIHPIRTANYPTPATRPAFSVLDTTQSVSALGLAPAYWRDNLRQMLRNHQENLKAHA